MTTRSRLQRAVRCVVLILALPVLMAAKWPEWAEAVTSEADLDRYATEDAVVLLEQWQIKLKGGRRSGVRRRIVHVLTHEGRNAAVTALASGQFGGYKNARLWVRQPGGQTSKFFEEDGSLYGVSDLNTLDETQVLVIHPPGLTTGSTVAIESRFHREADRPQDLFRVQENIPVARAVISLDARGGWGALAHVANGTNPGPVEARQQAVWEFADLPANSVSEVPFSPAPPTTTIALDYVPPGRTSPFADWSTTAQWMAGLFRQPDSDRPLVQASLAELRASSDDIVEAAGLFARSLRYYAIELGWGGYVPRTPETTLRRSFGDCKDKAQLMITLLRGAGIEAYPVLVIAPSDGHVPDELPSPFQFNHAIVAIRWEGRDTGPGMTVMEHPDLGPLRFFDATLSDASPQDIGLPLEGGAALVIHPETTGLIRLPGTSAADNVIERRFDLTIAADGSLRVSAEVRAHGVMRSPLAGEDGEYIRPDELRTSVYERLARFLPDVRDLEIGPIVEDADGTWGYSFQVSSDGLLADFGAVNVLELGSLMPPGVLPLPSEDDPSDTVFLPLQGTHREIYTVTSEDRDVLGITGSIEVVNELGHVRLDTRIDQGAIRIEREFGLTSLEVAAGQRELVVALRGALRQANGVAVVFGGDEVE